MLLLNALLTPNIGLMFWTIVIFLLLLFILRKFAWKPITDMLKAREESIDEALNQAKKAREEVDALTAKNFELVVEGQTQRDAIIKEAKERSDQIINEAKKAAKVEGKRIVDDAREMVKRERENVMQEIKNEISSLVIETASMVIKKELSLNKEHQELISNKIKELQ
jgi:F-type H+-transporting ATPase subunit b